MFLHAALAVALYAAFARNNRGRIAQALLLHVCCGCLAMAAQLSVATAVVAVPVAVLLARSTKAAEASGDGGGDGSVGAGGAKRGGDALSPSTAGVTHGAVTNATFSTRALPICLCVEEEEREADRPHTCSAVVERVAKQNVWCLMLACLFAKIPATNARLSTNTPLPSHPATQPTNQPTDHSLNQSIHQPGVFVGSLLLVVAYGIGLLCLAAFVNGGSWVRVSFFSCFVCSFM